jgi:tetratricopeptide (TPR) repeat protein
MTTQPAARQGRTLVFVLAVLLLLAGAVGAYLWWPSGPAAPPEIPLDGVEPDVARAVRVARAAVVKEPRSAASWGLLGRTLLANEMNTDISLVCFLEAERLDPKDPRWPYFAAGDLLNLGKGAEALPKLRRAVELCAPNDKTQLTARLWLAETLRTLGQLDAAEDQFQKVLAAAPNEPRAHFGLGMLAYERGQWPACRTHLEKCVGSPHARKKACVQLATVCERLGDKQNADRYADLAAHLPNDPGWADPFVAENFRLAKRKRDQDRYVE